MNCVTRFLWLSAAAVLAGCLDEPGVPEDAAITCQSDGDCLEGFFCNPGLGRCVQDGVVNRPDVSIGAVPRSTAPVVAIPVTIRDLDVETVQLSLFYRVRDDQEWLLASTSGESAFDATVNPRVESLSWRASDDLGGTAYVSGLQARVVASSPLGEASDAVSEPFAYGNDAPLLSAARITTPGRPTVSDIAVVELDVSDSAADPVRVRSFRFSPTGEEADAFELEIDSPVLFPTGARDGLFTQEDAVTTHSFAWSSRSASPTSTNGAWVEIVVEDELASGALSSEPVRVVFDTRNNRAPEILDLVISDSQEREVSEAVPVIIRVADDEADPVDVEMDVSFDGGRNWAPAPELPLPVSEGRYDWMTRPAAEGGVEHAFVWDGGAIGARYPLSAEFRVRLSDGQIREGIVEARRTLNWGVGDESSQLWRMGPEITGSGIRHSVITDVTGDQRNDVVTISSDAIRVQDNLGGDSELSLASPRSVTFDGAPGLARALPGDFASAEGPELVVAARDHDAVYLLTQSQLDSADDTSPSEIAEESYPVCDGPTRIFDGDFDADGNLDILVLCTSDAVTIYFGDPTAATGARFVDRIDVNEPDVADVSVADFDGDGRDDWIAFLDPQSCNAFITNAPAYRLHLSPVAGRPVAFTASAAVGLTQFTTALQAGDMDNDGVAEIVTMECAGELRVLRPEDAGFTELFAGQGGITPVDMRLADLDGNERLDVVTYENTQNLTVWLQPNADEIFFQPFVRLFPLSGIFRSVSVGDVDGDGVLDIASAWNSDVTLATSAQSREPSFSRVSSFDTAVEPDAIAAADLDLDGATDFIYGDSRGTTPSTFALTMYSQTGRPIASLSTHRLAESAIELFRSDDVLDEVRVVDLNRDDAPDVVVLNDGVYYVSVLGRLQVAWGERDTEGRHRLGQLQDYGELDRPSALAISDLDGDGDRDFVVAELLSTQAHILYTEASSVTPGPVLSIISGTPRGVAIADLDGDACKDIAVSVDGAVVGVRLFRCDGAGGYEYWDFVSFGGGSTAVGDVVVDDVDRDGLLDLVVLAGALASDAGPRVALNSPIGFSSAGVPSTGAFGASLRGMALIDLNGDGRRDALGVSDDALVFSVARTEASADGQWYATATRVALGLDVNDFEVADVNNDGRPDVILRSRDRRILISSTLFASLGAGSSRTLSLESAVPGQGEALVQVERRSGLDRFGQAYEAPTVSVRVHSGPLPGLDHAPWVALLEEGLLGPNGYRPITVPTEVSGDRHLRRVPIASGTAIRVESRLGPRLDEDPARRAGLSSDVGRSAILELPLRSDAESFDVSSVRLFVYAPDWRRSTELTSSRPTPSTDPSWLPLMTLGGGRVGPVLKETGAWFELAAVNVGNFADGSGNRFAFDAQRRVLRVATDRFGIFLATAASP